MKPGSWIFFLVLLTCSFTQLARGDEPDPGAANVNTSSMAESEALVESLQQELIDAKSRVSELEAELLSAQNTIEQMENQAATQEGPTGSAKPVKAVNRTVNGQPVYDKNNPRKPVAQSDIITEKYTANVQSQPYAVTRLLEADIERGGIQHLDRVADLVPNMQFGFSGNEARVAIRGARTNRTGAEAEQVVAIFEDGVSVPTTTQAMGPYVDTNRIEVIRGPQGVMYGRNALGGVINVISNQPDLKGWDYSLEGQYGYADGARFDAMLNMPLLDTLVTRIAARYDLHSGYVGNHILEGDADDLRDKKQQYVRWMTRWQPTDEFSLQLNLTSLDQNQTGSGMWGYQQIGAYVDGQFLPGHQFAEPWITQDGGPWSVARNFASVEDQENLSTSLKLNWNFGFATLEWLTSKSKFENLQIFDGDYSNGGDPFNSDFNGWDSFRDTLTSEIRLASNNSGRFDWTVGLYWLDLESDWAWLETRGRVFQQPEWDSTGEYHTDSTAAFVSAGFEVTDNLRISGGLRWYDDSKQLRNGASDSWTGVLWNAGVEYALSDSVNTYITASTGYKPGGINEITGVHGSYDAENVTAIELGMKSILADDSLVLNLSAFYSDYSDMQAQSFTILPLPGTAGLMDYMSTAGDMESKGLEAELQWLPGSRWNISANLAWLDAEFTDYTVANLAGLGDIAGHTMGDTLSLNGWRPALSSEWSFGMQASYVFGLGDWGTITPMIQTSYVSDYYANDLNLAGALQEAQLKTDIRIFWDMPGNRLKLQFYIENMDEESTLKNVMIYNPVERPEIATFLASWGDPRTYGMILSYRY